MWVVGGSRESPILSLAARLTSLLGTPCPELINCLHGLEEVHGYNISLECEVPHGHNDICRCDITGTSVSTAITCSTEPEIRIREGLVLETEHGPPHKFTDAVRASGS